MKEKKLNKVDITIVLDKSGSMGTIQQDTIGGFNTFLKTQKELPNETRISLAQFSNGYSWTYHNLPIKEAPELSRDTFVPNGGTALLDAVGFIIQSTGTRLRDMKEADRPDVVMFVIITDGEENSSITFTRQKVFEMIAHQKDKYSWDFVFLGANQDAIHTGSQLGIGIGKSMSYAANNIGTQTVFSSLATYTTNASRAANANMVASNAFTSEDRDKQTAAGAAKPRTTSASI